MVKGVRLKSRREGIGNSLFLLNPKCADYINYIGSWPSNKGNQLLNSSVPCMSICMSACLKSRLATRRWRLLHLDARLTLVLEAPHDISPPVDKQLVLELEVGVVVDEAVNVLPCC